MKKKYKHRVCVRCGGTEFYIGPKYKYCIPCFKELEDEVNKENS